MSDTRVALIIAVLSAAMAMSVYLGWRSRAGAVSLALLSVLWILVDQDFEGPVLLIVSTHNGLTLSDLVGVVGLLGAGVLLLRHR